MWLAVGSSCCDFPTLMDCNLGLEDKSLLSRSHSVRKFYHISRNETRRVRTRQLFRCVPVVHCDSFLRLAVFLVWVSVLSYLLIVVGYRRRLLFTVFHYCSFCLWPLVWLCCWSSSWTLWTQVIPPCQGTWIGWHYSFLPCLPYGDSKHDHVLPHYLSRLRILLNMTLCPVRIQSQLIWHYKVSYLLIIKGTWKTNLHSCSLYTSLLLSVFSSLSLVFPGRSSQWWWHIPCL